MAIIVQFLVIDGKFKNYFYDNVMTVVFNKERISTLK